MMLAFQYKKGAIVFLILALLSSCFKEDEKVPFRSQGDLKRNQVVYYPDYRQQVYFDLTSNSVISSNLISDWDLAFASQKEKWVVKLNAAQMMYATSTADTNFKQNITLGSLHFKFDSSDGNEDSLAINHWYRLEGGQPKSLNTVYVINRGMDENMKELGYKKIQLNIKNGQYALRYANLDGSDEHEVLIAKDQAFHFRCFSFKTNKVEQIEPAKDSWSLKFSKYSTMLSTGTEMIPYSVTGVLLGDPQMLVALDTISFENISIQDTARLVFSHHLDAIGYDWKYYNFDSGMYSMVANKSYVIKNYDSRYFKLRFIDFYDDKGTKGTLSFEFIEL